MTDAMKDNRRQPAAKSDVIALQSDMTEVKSDVTTVKSGVSALKSDVSALKSDVGALKSDVGALKSDVGALKSDVGALKSDVTSLKAEFGLMRNEFKAFREDIREMFRPIILTLAHHTAELADIRGYIKEKLVTRDEFHSRMDGFTGRIDDADYSWAKQRVRQDEHEKRISALEIKRA